MTRIISLLSAVIMIIVLTTVLSITSCQKEARNQSQTLPDNVELANRAAPLKVDLVHVYPLVEDENMHPIDGDTPVATLLFNNQGHAPVLAPDGHQVTFGEYNMASGWASIKCINGHACSDSPKRIDPKWCLHNMDRYVQISRF